MLLTDIKIKNAKFLSKVYKLGDGEGMFLQVHLSGSKYWRLKYRFAGKEKLLALGVYPDVSLQQAREKRLEARKQLSLGNDPAILKKELKRQVLINAENSFENIAREWHAHRESNWTARYAGFVLKRLETDIFPQLGSRTIKEISAPELLSVLRMIEKRGALEIAQRLLQCCSQIFMYAIATGRAVRNPAPDLRGALKIPVKKHYAHLKEDELPEFLKRLENYEGELQTKLAVKLLILTFVRTTELCGAKWSEIDLVKAEWRIPVDRMKMRREHIVPLSNQALKIFYELQKLTGWWQYVFPSQIKPIQYMSNSTILGALYRLGYHKRATGHGFRHTASTILNENNFRPDVIERQLAHVERNKVRGVYNHAEYLPERRQMMQWWGDYIEKLADV